MARKWNIFIAGSVAIATELGLGVLMSIPFAAAYLPIASFYLLVFGILLGRERLSKSIDAWFARRRSCVIKAIWLLDIIGALTLICAITAFMFEPIAWLRIFPDKVPASSGFSLHVGFSAVVSAVCVLLYAWQVHVYKNKRSDRRGNRVLSLVIQYLRNETTDCRGKSDGYLIKQLVFEIKVGRLHLWGRKNNKDIFVRPKDFKSKRYVFELYHHEYRLRSPVDETVIWGAAFIEREVTEKWPQIKPSASD